MKTKNKPHPSLIFIPPNSRVLRLTLDKKAFEITGTDDKPFELRRKSKWIESRLFNKDGSYKQYDYVLFVNGYGNDKPWFIIEFKLCFQFIKPYLPKYKFSNGLEWDVQENDYFIELGESVAKGNLTKLHDKNKAYNYVFEKNLKRNVYLFKNHCIFALD